MPTLPVPLRRGPISATDISSVAGFLEGEGCFSIESPRRHWTRRGQRVTQSYRSFAITASSTDHDVLEKMAVLMGAKIYALKPRPGHKPTWSMWINRTELVVGWVMTIYSMMGERRRAKIREILAIWKAMPKTKWGRANLIDTDRMCGNNLHPVSAGTRGRCEPCYVALAAKAGAQIA